MKARPVTLICCFIGLTVLLSKPTRTVGSAVRKNTSVVLASNGSPFIEVVYLDMRLGYAGPVATTTVLEYGVPYVVQVFGTWSAWWPYLWSSYCGQPEDLPAYLSAGVANGKVGVDAEYVFAAPIGKVWCESEPGDPPWRLHNFEISLDDGATWFVAEPSDAAYNENHLYEYPIVGQGFHAQFRKWDSVTDNYGVLAVFLKHPSPTAPLLQLPFDPNDPDQTKVGESCRGTNNALGACTTAYMDHHYPTYQVNADGIFRPFWGEVINSTTQPCSTRLHPDWCYDGHEGHDYRLVEDTIVRAAAAGTAHCEWDSTGYGYTVLIDHGNGYSTRYAHLKDCKELFAGGDKPVIAGQEVGRVGFGGTGYHLHFGVYYDGEPVDPWGWNGSRGPDPWVADRNGPRSICLWDFRCNLVTYVTPTSAGHFTSPDGSTSASLPAGAVTDTTSLELTFAPDPVAQPSAVPAGYSFDLSAQDIYGNAVETFLQPLTIVINYAQSIVDYVIENTLTLHYWDHASQSWLPLPTILDLGNNTATATTDHLTLFTLLGEPENPAPTITSVSPTGGYNHLDTEITIEGTGFLPTPSAQLGIGELGVTFVDSTTLSAVVPSGYDAGSYDLTVTNPDAQQATLESVFVVKAPLRVCLPLMMKSY